MEAEEKITGMHGIPCQANLTRFLHKIYKNDIFTIQHQVRFLTKTFHFFWIKILLDSRNCSKCASVFLIISVNTFPPKLHHLSIFYLRKGCRCIEISTFVKYLSVLDSTNQKLTGQVEILNVQMADQLRESKYKEQLLNATDLIQLYNFYLFSVRILGSSILML